MGPQVKGIAFRSALRALDQVRGAQTVETAIALMSAELSSAIRYGTIIAASWYPIEWYRELFRAIAEGTKGGEGIVREIGRESARLDMTGIYRAAFKLLSPQALFGLSTRLFSNYYDTGSVSILESRQGFALARWMNCEGFDRNLWLEVIASSEMFLELAGARQVRMRVLSGAGRDDDFAEVQAHWT
ncbi:MAG: hypothetical protein QM784_34510 [Polyangiaceae bacterium]